MDYSSRSLFKFLKVILVFTSVYWCILLSVLLFLIVEQGSSGSSRSTSDRDADANSRANQLMISLVPRPSEGGGGRKAWYPLHAHALHFPYNLP